MQKEIQMNRGDVRWTITAILLPAYLDQDRLG